MVVPTYNDLGIKYILYILYKLKFGWTNHSKTTKYYEYTKYILYKLKFPWINHKNIQNP